MKKCWIISQGDIPIDWVKRQVGPDDTLLALTLSALADCRRNFQRVLSVEDFVPYEEIMTLALRAHEINLEFSRRSCAGGTLEGYDWPKICWHMQQWFFRDALLAEALALFLKAAGFDRIVWVGDAGQEPTMYLPTFDVVAIVMGFHLKHQFEILHPPRKLIGQIVKRFGKNVQFGLEQAYKHTLYSEPIITRCQAVAVWSITEWDRYTDAMSEMIQEFGDQFQLWVLGAQYPNRLKEWARTAGVVPVTVSFPDTIEKNIIHFFRESWEYWVTKGRQSFATFVNHSIFDADQLQYHFKFHFLKIWPSMAQWAKKVERYLQMAAPSWVIGSSNYPPEWAFPHFVAEKLGISSIALPHSYVQYGDGVIGASYLACRNRLERLNFQRPFPDDGRILYCSNAGNALSYSAEPKHKYNYPDRRTVAFLTAHPDYTGSLMPTADRSAFLEALAALFSMPPDLKELNFAVKSHPRADVTPLLRNGMAHKPANLTLLDPSAPVIDLIEKAWIIVLGNHYGSVVIQAVMSGKPLIFLDSAKCFWPYTDKLALAAGEVIQDLPSFWNLIRRLRDSPALYQELTDRCRRFRMEYLQPVQKTLGQQIRSWEVRQSPFLGKHAGETTP